MSWNDVHSLYLTQCSPSLALLVHWLFFFMSWIKSFSIFFLESQANSHRLKPDLSVERLGDNASPQAVQLIQQRISLMRTHDVLDEKSRFLCADNIRLKKDIKELELLIKVVTHQVLHSSYVLMNEYHNQLIIEFSSWHQLSDVPPMLPCQVHASFKAHADNKAIYLAHAASTKPLIWPDQWYLTMFAQSHSIWSRWGQIKHWWSLCCDSIFMFQSTTTNKFENEAVMIKGKWCMSNREHGTWHCRPHLTQLFLPQKIVGGTVQLLSLKTCGTTQALGAYLSSHKDMLISVLWEPWCY